MNSLPVQTSASQQFDAVFVGSGVNGLVAAALLSKRGWRVAVLERSTWLGGAIRTVTSEQGFITELMSCFYVQFVGSPGYQLLRDDLARHGLEFANSDQPFSVITDEGDSLTITTDHQRNHDRLEQLRPGQGRAWDEAIGSTLGSAEDLFGLRNVHPLSRDALRWVLSMYRRRGRAGSVALAGELLSSARTWLTDTFEDPLIRAVLAPWALHGTAGPDESGSAIVVRAIAAFSELGGSPVPVGGGRAVVNALVSVIEENGGVCLTGTDVDSVVVEKGRAVGVTAGDRTFAASRAVACSVTPAQLYGRLLGGVSLPDGLEESARRFRSGPAVFQLSYSLDRPLRWDVREDLSRSAVIHISGGLDAVSRAANEARRSLLPAQSTVCVGQPMALDPSRGPAGTWQLWVQVLDVPGMPVGDAADEITVHDGWSPDVTSAFAARIERRIARHLPGFEDSIVERTVLSPADLEAANINLIGGSTLSGAADIDQMLVFRPSPYAPSPGTHLQGLYHIGASTHPGASLAAGSGYLLAQRLLATGIDLRQRFGRGLRGLGDSRGRRTLVPSSGR